MCLPDLKKTCSIFDKGKLHPQPTHPWIRLAFAGFQLCSGPRNAGPGQVPGSHRHAQEQIFSPSVNSQRISNAGLEVHTHARMHTRTHTRVRVRKLANKHAHTHSQLNGTSSTKYLCCLQRNYLLRSLQTRFFFSRGGHTGHASIIDARQFLTRPNI